MPDALEVRSLSHRFGDLPTLEDVDLSVGPVELLSVLGPSGSGKTTLLRAIAGFVVPHRGTISIGGVEVLAGGRERLPAERRNVGMVFQDYALFPHLDVGKNIGFGIHRHPDREHRIEELLELTGMRDLRDRRPAELSGGQQQRVALARALAPRPSLLLLDEPFANVDRDRRSALIDELRGILGAEGTSAVLVTHDRSEALAMSDRVAVLGQTEGGGRLLQCDAPQIVYNRPHDRLTARITGDAQFIDGKARGGEADTPLGRIRLVEERHGPVVFVLRPESLRWRDDDGGGSVVSSLQFVGRGYRMWCSTPAGPIRVELRGMEPPPVGARGSITIEGACWALPEGRGSRDGEGRHA